ncbi:calpain cysteine peptidase [Strigomonas culicis]|uniref:Calpain cysteine peptidase n=1 Tax=Strigomonas culicis TaxID=28005 RepID=S9V6Y5_9TRYP|nr:calpain cysteine peptidase [Strigomonas culicis]|eukprot:EPY18665.1 calpain cysteine peptidase [Strigomonas culicis]
MDNHKLVHKGVFQSTREVCDFVTIPAQSLNYLVGSCLQKEKTKFILSYWFLNQSDAANVAIKRYQADVSRKQPAVAAVALANRGKQRIDFLVDTPTNIHILLQQDTPPLPNRSGDIVTDDFCAMYLFDADNNLVKGVPSAMSFREMSIVEHLPKKGRYALSITCPRGGGSVPCKVEIVGVEESHVRITDTPENAEELTAVDLGFMSQEQCGFALPDLPLDSDSIFQEKLEALRELLKDPNADPAEVKKLQAQLNARAHELAVTLMSSERPVYLPDRDLDALNPLLDSDDAYMAEECTRYQLKKDPRSQYKVLEQEEKLRNMADRIAEEFRNNNLEFLNEAFDGVPVEDLPLRSDEQFAALLRQRAVLMKHPTENAAEIAKLEAEMNERAKEIACALHEKERAFLEEDTEGIPLDMLGLNEDATYVDLENHLRALMGSENADPEEVKKLQEALKGRAQELATELKLSEREKFLAHEFNGVSADALHLDDDATYHEMELRRLALMQEDPVKNTEEIQKLEKEMNTRAVELATELQNRERAFLASEETNSDVLREVLNQDPEFLAKEAKLRELMKDPRGNGAAITALKEELAETAKQAYQKYAEEQRGLFLKEEYEGYSKEELLLSNDAAYVEAENRYLALLLDPSQAKPGEMEEVQQFLTARAAEIARVKTLKERIAFLGPNVRSVPLKDLPLNSDEKYRALEQERARALRDPTKQEYVAEVEAAMKARAMELVKAMFAQDRAYLNPEPAGVPVELVPLDDDPAFQQLETERAEAKHSGLAAALNIKEKALNDRAAVVAQELKEKERSLFMENEYVHVPRQAIPLDADPAFKEAEIARLRLRKEDPEKNAAEITALEQRMVVRAGDLAKVQQEADRAFLSNQQVAVGGELLNKVLDGDEEFLKMQERIRTLIKDPVANAKAIKNLETQMAERAKKLTDDFVAAERATYLNEAYEGRAREDLPLDQDAVYKKLESEYLALSQDPNADPEKLAQLRAAMDERALAVAREINKHDQQRYLSERFHGVPFEALGLDADEKFNELQALRAAVLRDPSRAGEVAALEEALQKRADEIARARLAADRAYLDEAPEGIPLSCIRIEEDRDFNSKEEQRAALVAENKPAKNGKTITALEESMNTQVHAMAKKLKEKQIEECVDSSIRGVSRGLLSLSEDAECTNLIAERTKALLAGDAAEAQRLADEINKRAHTVADEVIETLRNNLMQDPLRVSLEDLNLDGDAQFKEMENEALKYMLDPKKNAAKLKDLYEEMDHRAAQLAEEKLWTEREEYMEAAPEGRALRELPLNSDENLLNMERQRREMLKSGTVDPAVRAELDKKLNTCATEKAQVANAGDRGGFLGATIRGFPVSALGLDQDEQFRELERQRAANKRSRGTNGEAIEEALRKRAAEVADEKLKNDRDFLDANPEGVALRQVPLDGDKAFRQLEEKRAALKHSGTATDKEIAAVEEKMNKRAHELAAAMKEAGRSLVSQKPQGIPLADLHLDEDEVLTQLEEAYRDAVETGDKAAQQDLRRKMNEHIVELTATLHAKERSELNQNPRGLPMSILPVDEDPIFMRLENEARALRARQPTSTRLDDIKDELNARAAELADEARLKYLGPAPGGIPLKLVRFEDQPEFLKAEEERRELLKKDPSAEKELNKRLNTMLEVIAEECITGDRSYFEQEPGGVPLEYLPLDTDPKFREAELERVKLIAEDPQKNAAKIKAYEAKLKERLNELVAELKKSDVEGLEGAPRGIPLENLKPPRGRGVCRYGGPAASAQEGPRREQRSHSKTTRANERAGLSNRNGADSIGPRVSR